MGLLDTLSTLANAAKVAKAVKDAYDTYNKRSSSSGKSTATASSSKNRETANKQANKQKEQEQKKKEQERQKKEQEKKKATATNTSTKTSKSSSKSSSSSTAIKLPESPFDQVQNNATKTPLKPSTTTSTSKQSSSSSKAPVIDLNDTLRTFLNKGKQNERDTQRSRMFELSYAIDAKNAATAKPYTQNDVRENYDVNAGGTNVKGNTKFKVNTVTATDYRDVSTGLQNNRYEVWVVEDGDSIKQDKLYNRSFETEKGNKATTPTLYSSIGRDRLDGVSQNDKYVLYDKQTGKFFRYAQDASLDEKRRTAKGYETQIRSMANKYDWVENSYRTELDKLAAKQQEYINAATNRRLTNAEYKELQQLQTKYDAIVKAQEDSYQEYSNKYYDVLKKYNAVNAAISAKGITGDEVSMYYQLKPYVEAANNIKNGKGTADDRRLLTNAFHSLTLPEDMRRKFDKISAQMQSDATVYANADYRKQIDGYVDEIIKGAKDYEEETKYHSSMDNPNQINSALDVAKRAISRLVWDQYQDSSISEDMVELFKMHAYNMYDHATAPDFSAAGFAGAVLNQTLVGLSEDLDFTNVFKPFLAGGLYYIRGNYEDPAYAAWLKGQTDKEFAELTPAAKYFFEMPDGTAGGGFIDKANYAGWVAFKAWLGAYGKLPNFDYYNAVSTEDRNAGTFMATAALDIFLDPGTYVDLFKAGVKRGVTSSATANAAQELLDKQYKNWANNGVQVFIKNDLTEEALEQLTKTATENGKLFVVRSKDMDDKILKAYRNAISKAYTAGGGDKVMIDALTAASNKVTDQLFDTGLVRKYLDKLPADSTVRRMAEKVTGQLDNMSLTARIAYQKSVDEFTESSAKQAAKVFGNTVAEDGTAIAKLVYDTPKIIKTMHTIDEIGEIIGKAIKVVEAPELVIPVSIARGVNKAVKVMRSGNLAEIVAEALPSINATMQKAAANHNVFKADVAKDMRDITDKINVLYTNAGMSKEATMFFNNFEHDAFESFSKHVTADTFNELNDIFARLGSSDDASVEVFTALEEFAKAHGFDTFKDANAALIKNMPVFTGMSAASEAMYAQFKRNYVDAIAERQAYGARQLTNVYTNTAAEIQQHLSNIKEVTPNNIVHLENIHTAVQVLRDNFNAKIPLTHVTEESYKEAANSLIKTIKAVGDASTDFTEWVKATDALNDKVQDFLNATSEYLKDIDDYKSTLAFKSYVHTPPTQYVSSIADKEVIRSNQAANRVEEGIRKELQQYHGINVSVKDIQDSGIVKDNLCDVLINADGTLNAENLQRCYAVTLSKYTNAVQYTSDEAMQQIVHDVLDINNAVNCALNNVKGSIDALLTEAREASKVNDALVDTLEANRQTVQGFIQTCAEQKNTRTFFEQFEKAAVANQTADENINAVLDAFAGDKVGRINRNARKWIDTHNSIYIDNIVEEITRDAEEYIRQRVPDKPIDYLWHYNCNTIDTAANVDNIERQAQILLNKSNEVLEDSDQYLDVFYSCAGTTRGADPFMVSFKVNGVTQTFRNADSPFMIHATHAKRMYNKSVEELTDEYSAVTKNIPGTHKDKYIQDVQAHVVTLNQMATDANKQLRFIGFNAGAATSDMDHFIKGFLTSNGIPVRWNSAVDVGELIRLSQGYAVLDDGAVMAIRKAVVETLESARTDVLLHDVSGNIVMDTSPKLGEQMAALNDVAQQYSVDAQRALIPIMDGVKNTAKTIDNYRNSIGGEELGKIISEREIADFIDAATNCLDPNRRINNMRALYNSLADIGMDARNSLQLKKVFDHAAVNDWFDDKVINDIIKADMEALPVSQRIDTLNNVARILNSKYEAIFNPELLDAIGVDSYRDVYNAAVIKFMDSPKFLGTPLAPMLAHMQLNTAQDYFVALDYLVNTYAGVTHYDVKDIVQELRTLLPNVHPTSKNWDDAVITLFPDTSAAVVYNNKVARRFDTVTNIIETKYASVNERTVRTKALMEQAENAAAEARSLGTYLDLKEAIYKKNNLLATDERINYELFSQVCAPYLQLVDELNELNPYKAKLVEGAQGLDSAIIRATFDNKMATKLKAVANVYDAHKSAAVLSALTLSDEDFEKYVVRYAMNSLVIDPNAAMFKEPHIGELLGKRITSILDNPKATLRVTKLDVDGKACIGIYKDINNADYAAVDELVNSLNNTHLNLAERYFNALHDSQAAIFNGMLQAEDTVDLRDNFAKMNTRFNKCMDGMTAYMPEHYYGSTLDVTTQDTIRALQEYFPESTRLNLNRVNNWFDESYNCSIWGDIDLQRTFNPYASDKLLDNMGRGLHHVRNKMDATTNLVRLFNNPTQSLRSMLTAVHAENTPWKVVKQQLDDRGYVLATLTQENGKYYASKMPLDNAKDFKRYMRDNSVVVMESAVFNKLNAYVSDTHAADWYNTMHGNIVSSKLYDMYKTWERTFRSARVTGMLFLSNIKGTGIKNVADSSLKGFNDNGFNFLKHVGNAVEYQKAYHTTIVPAITEEFKVVNSDTIAKYFQKHPNAVLPQDIVEKLYMFNDLATTSMSDTLDVMKDKAVAKMKALLPADKYTDTELKEIAEIFNNVHADKKYVNMPGVVKDTVQSQMYGKAFEALKQLKVANTNVPRYTVEEAEELAQLFYKYTPTAHTWGNALAEVPVIRTLLASNAKTFQNAETRSRTALFLSYLDELDSTVSKAEEAIVRTQFDYSKRGVIGAIETLLPFTTFKIYNAAYWVEEASNSFTSMKNITRITRATDGLYDKYDIAQQIRNTHVAQLMLDENNNPGEDDSSDSVAEWFTDNILGYKGVPEAYASGLRLGNNHYVKVGNSFTDALKFGSDLFAAPGQIARGQMPTILADSVYAPLGVFYKWLADTDKTDAVNPTDEQWYTNNSDSYNRFGAWTADHYSDIANLIPAYGMLTNMILTHIKHGAANLADLKMTLCDESLKDAYMQTALQALYDTASTIFPSIVGIINNTNSYGGARNYYLREVGLDWYSNTNVEEIQKRINPDTGALYTREEAEKYAQQYRGTHQFKAGISSIPAFMGKDPATYVNYTAMLLKMGFDEADVKANLKTVLEQLYGGGLLKDSMTNGVYFNADGKGNTYLDMNFLEDTMAAMAAQGYTIDEVLQQLRSQKWFNPVDGKLYTNGEAYRAMMNSAFLSNYQHLPEYVRYDKAQYAQLMAYWKAMGLSTEGAWIMMQHEHGFIDEQGQYRVLTDAQVQAYTEQLNNDYYEFTSALPDWYKYEPGAASRTIAYLVNTGMTKEQAQRYILEHNAYLDVDGVMHHLTTKESALRTQEASEEFLSYYSALPDYIKYEKGAYSRTLQYLKDIEGVDTETAKQMIFNGAYLTVDGRLIDCSDLERERMLRRNMSEDEWNAYFASLPDYTKYTKGAFKATYAALKEQGYDRDTIFKMIAEGAFVDEQGNIIDVTGKTMPVLGYETFEQYYDALPEITKYTKGAFKATYAALKEQGYDKNTILQLIHDGICLGENGEFFNVAGKTKPVLGYDTFKEYYSTLPDYIKYEKGAYKRTYQMLKDLGFAYEDSLSLIKQGAYLMEADKNSAWFNQTSNPRKFVSTDKLDVLLRQTDHVLLHQNGKTYMLIDCSGLKRYRRSGYYAYGDRYMKYHYTNGMRPKRSKPIKHYFNKAYVKKPYVTRKSYSSTYSKVDVLAGASYGARKVYKVNLGFNPVRQSLSIKSTYPASYRNIVYSTRRNLYKDMYAKYGLSRMTLRANTMHTYSNASITRLRRNEIQNRIQFGNRRKF